ncbi:MAG: DNA translocase FtsK, partial [Victivallaceae bacterium]
MRQLIGYVGTVVVGGVFLTCGSLIIYFADWHKVLVALYTHLTREYEDEYASSRNKAEKTAKPEKTSREESIPAAETKPANEQPGIFAIARRALMKLRQTPQDAGNANAADVIRTSSITVAKPTTPPETAIPEDLFANEELNDSATAGQRVQPQNSAPSPTIPPAMPVTPPPAAAEQPPEIPFTTPTAQPTRLNNAEPNIRPTVQGHNLSAPRNANDFILPPVTMLCKGPENTGESREFIAKAQDKLQKTLDSFNVNGHVSGIISGPRVTRYEISLEPGVKVEKITAIANNIAMQMEAESIRVLAPIPGRNAVGVEAPNSKSEAVFARSIMEDDEWKLSRADIPIVLGRDVAGKSIILDLAKAPHLLIAGSTGSGKSVCMNTLIMSLLFHFPPEMMRLIMVDPKVVELEDYKTLPHLITPVVNESGKVPIALRWAVNEMEKRYRILAKARVKNLKGYNTRPAEPAPVMDENGDPIPLKMPYLVIIVDELADVMMTDARSEVETSIARIAQKGRAAGIHIVIATQRPSTNIITGVIKANLPTRIAFRVGSIVDSRVILDQKGAETLLGKGDMLLVPPGSANLERIQGAMVDDNDIKKVVEFIAGQVEQHFDEQVISNNDDETENEEPEFTGTRGSRGVNLTPAMRRYLAAGDDELVKKALEIILNERKASTSYLQRRLGIGYNKAAELIDLFETRGIIGPQTTG